MNCLFSNERIIVLFYVDDIILIHHERDNNIANSFEAHLMRTYQTKPLGQIDHFLGIRVVRNELMRKIWLVQDSYIDSIAKEFNIVLDNDKTPSTPGVSKLSEFLQNPSQQHMEASEHMMKYLVATKFRGIEYNGDFTNEAGKTFVASSDASFADQTDTRCSSNGFCFQLFGGMIHWKAK